MQKEKKKKSTGLNCKKKVTQKKIKAFSMAQEKNVLEAIYKCGLSGTASLQPMDVQAGPGPSPGMEGSELLIEVAHVPQKVPAGLNSKAASPSVLMQRNIPCGKQIVD